MALKSSIAYAVCVSLLAVLPLSRAPQAETGATKATPQWPRVIEEAAPEPPSWSAEEVTAAKNRCTALLQGLHVVAVPMDPIREGECGAPAPFELISIGRNPQVTFSPPPTVTCELIHALDGWLKSDVQVAARTMLDGPVVRIELMSDYSCRNAYGRKKSRLSEHARANAIDIAAFLTERGTSAKVLADWGMTERDVKARIAAAEKAAREQAALKAALAKAAPIAVPTPAPPRQIVAGEALKPARPAPSVEDLMLKGAITDGLSSQASAGLARAIGRGRANDTGSVGFVPSNHLGGPKADTTPAGDGSTPRQRFLKRIHASACQTFGTSLGPEANEFHRNHFHVDMAVRQSIRICE